MSSKSFNQLGQLQLSFGGQRQVFRVSELNAAVQDVFSASFTQIWVAGEISGCRTAASGHHYFCLKDAQSQVKCVLFKSSGRFARIKPQDGLAVAVQGNLEIYQARGEYHLIVERLDLHGTGSLQLPFEQLKPRLASEGLFQQDRKRTLPRLPHRIGLITSLSGAVLQDILTVLARRFPGLHIRLYPAQVQGEGSVEQLCTALQYFSQNSWADVVILARGGGSLEDLWSFNDERLARVIASSTVPVISAVGHETDFTIADFVADHRAPTPSAAAEVVICTRESLLLQISESSTRILRSLRYRLMVLSRDVDGRSGDRGLALMHRALSRRMQQVDEADQQLRRWAERHVEMLRRKLAQMQQRLQQTNLLLRFSRNRHRQDLLAEQLAQSWRTSHWKYKQRLERATSHLLQLSPLTVLARGYAIVEKPSREILRSASEASVHEELTIRLHAGKIKAVVSATEAGSEPSFVQ